MYLNGYKLEDIISHSLPSELSHYAGGMGFSYEFAALTMISLKGNRTSRLVQGLICREWNGRLILDTHSWVECKVDGDEKVIDLYMPSVVTDKEEYYRANKVEAMFVCRYKKFWRTETVLDIYTCLQHEDTSHVFYMLSNFRPHFPDQFFGFCIKVVPDEIENFGIEMPDSWVALDGKRYTINQELFDSIMAP